MALQVICKGRIPWIIDIPDVMLPGLIAVIYSNLNPKIERTEVKSNLKTVFTIYKYFGANHFYRTSQ